MKLIFTILESGDNKPFKQNFQFNKKNGSIGRSNNSSWQLNDKRNYISNVHVNIEYNNGSYYIVDESTNGTFLKIPRRKLPKGTRVKINNENIFVIGKYEIKAMIVEDDFSNSVVNNFDENNSENKTNNIIPDDSFLDSEPFDSLEEEEIDVMKLVSKGNNNSTEGTISSGTISDEQNTYIEEQHVSIPKASNKNQNANNNIQNTSLERTVGILEKKLGIEICSLEKNDRDIIMNELADIIINTLSGLKNSLHTKEKIKEDLKILKVDDRTSDINPILFGESASSLLQNNKTSELLGMSKVSDAILQSFDEIDHHNIALHSSSKNLMNIAMSKFSPKNLELHFEKVGILRPVFAFKSIARWKAYKELFKKVDEEPEAGIKMISDEFSQEYRNIAFSLKLSEKKYIKRIK